MGLLGRYLFVSYGNSDIVIKFKYWQKWEKHHQIKASVRRGHTRCWATRITPKKPKQKKQSKIRTKKIQWILIKPYPCQQIRFSKFWAKSRLLLIQKVVKNTENLWVTKFRPRLKNTNREKSKRHYKMRAKLPRTGQNSSATSKLPRKMKQKTTWMITLAIWTKLRSTEIQDTKLSTSCSPRQTSSSPRRQVSILSHDQLVSIQLGQEEE